MNAISARTLSAESEINPSLPLLYGASPYGLGTGQVEALTSFASRLADRRHLRASPLMMSALRDARDATKGGSKRHDHQTNGMAKGAKATVDAFNRSLGVDWVEHLTLVPWSELIEPAMHGTLRDHVAYCRECIQEDKHSIDTPYIRLLWFIKPIDSCPLHKTRLYDACITCGDRLRAIPWLNNPFFCMTCRKDISNQKGARFQGRPTHLGQWTANELTKLMGLTNGGCHQIEPNALSDAFRYIVDRHFDGSTCEFAHHFEIDTVRASKYADGRCRPMFPVLLRMLYSLQISPVDLFLNRTESMPLTGRVKLSRISQDQARRRQLTERAKGRIRKDLRALLSSDGEIIGPSDFAKQYDLPFLTIRYHLPDLYSQHRARFDRQEKEKRETLRLARIKRVIGAANELVDDGIFPSQRKLKNTGLVTATDLTRTDIRKALRPVLNRFKRQQQGGDK